MQLVTDAHPQDPAADMALTERLLAAVARGERSALIRIFRPGPTVAFGRVDQRAAGFSDARAAAEAHGRVPVVRLGGGHAAAYDADSVVVEVIRPQAGIIGGLDERYEDLVALLRQALTGVGGAPAVALELGELPGEYCAGRFSLHLPGGPKVAGIAQRVVSGASLTTAVLTVGGGDALRATISDVYAALGVAVDPRVAGALSDAHPGAEAGQVAAALRDAARERYRGGR